LNVIIYVSIMLYPVMISLEHKMDFFLKIIKLKPERLRVTCMQISSLFFEIAILTNSVTVYYHH